MGILNLKVETELERCCLYVTERYNGVIDIDCIVREIVSNLDDRVYKLSHGSTVAAVGVAYEPAECLACRVNWLGSSTYSIYVDRLRLEFSALDECVEFVTADIDRLDFAVLVYINDIAELHRVDVYRKHEVVDVDACCGVGVR